MKKSKNKRWKITKNLFWSQFLTGTSTSLSEYGASFIDALIISMFLGTEAIAAQGLAVPFFAIVSFLGGTIGVGMKVMCSRLLGRGDINKVNRYVSKSLFVGILISVITTILVLVFPKPFSMLLGARGNSGVILSQFFAGIADALNKIQADIDETTNQLNKEKSDKVFFIQNIETTYGKAIELEKSFLRICSILPGVKAVYKMEEKQEQDITDLKEIMDHLGECKRSLDNYVHSNTKQPFSVLRGKLDELSETYDKAYKGMIDFKAYLDSIKTSSEEAFSLVFVYFYRCKQIEALIREMNIDNITNSYADKIANCYELINQIDILIKSKPIDVLAVNEKVEELKNTANGLFDEIEEKSREMQLAESAVVYANRDRNHQTDVDQQLRNLEEIFFTGEFDKVYRDATTIYRRNHVEEADNGR